MKIVVMVNVHVLVDNCKEAFVNNVLAIFNNLNNTGMKPVEVPHKFCGP